MQGVDLSKIRGGRQGQQRVAQAVAMESANRILTRRALDVLKSIAIDEYVPPEVRQEEEAAPEGEAEAEVVQVESSAEDDEKAEETEATLDDISPEAEEAKSE
jgi:hypothetical protein